MSFKMKIIACSVTIGKSLLKFVNFFLSFLYIHLYENAFGLNYIFVRDINNVDLNI